MNTSSASHEQEEKSGRIGQAQQIFWETFKEFGPLTARQAIKIIAQERGVVYQQRCGRIAELTNMGLLELHDVVIDDVSGKRVNRWSATGRTTPLPMVCKFVECQKCGGKGGEFKSVYVREGKEQQGEMFQ